MHECLLFASIPAIQHDHILRVLAGIAAMQPLPVKDHVLIFKPNRIAVSQPTAIPGRPAPPTKAGAGNVSAAAAQAGNDQFYIQLVGDLTRSRSDAVFAVSNDTDSATTGTQSDEVQAHSLEAEAEAQANLSATNGKADVEMSEADDSTHDDIPWSTYSWSLQFKNLPEVLGKRPATSRYISTSAVRGRNPRFDVEKLGYDYMTSYLQLGHRLVHKSISLKLYQTIPLTNPLPSASRPNPAPTVPDDEGLASLKKLDPNGGYVLEAVVRVTDGSKPELMNIAFAELTNLKNQLNGVVALEPVERLVLDTRVRVAGGGAARNIGVKA